MIARDRGGVLSSQREREIWHALGLDLADGLPVRQPIWNSVILPLVLYYETFTEARKKPAGFPVHPDLVFARIHRLLAARYPSLWTGTPASLKHRALRLLGDS